ncbi:MAG: ATP synthase F0 subunit C [Firmicutes bacterium]|nr:ATP synthase F0 subunit C [Bacillota bacterium]MDY5531073.1 ATP synthase F0 subunit C [Pumilibacteraceae bacterium]
MSKSLKRIAMILCAVSLLAVLVVPSVTASAYDENVDRSGVVVQAETESPAVETQDQSKGSKAIAAGICVGLAAALGALAMGLAISKSNEAIARQPEATAQIKSGLMLGLVFIETAIIYALIVAILVIFVL